MKKEVLSVMFSLASLAAAYAQPTFTASTTNPVIGDVFYGHYADTAGVSKGASGAHATWNFASLTSLSSDTTIYMACDSTPGCSSFSGSNIAQFNGGDYAYGNASTSKFSLLGIYTNITGLGWTAIPYTDRMDVVRYPMTFNSAYVDTAVANFAAFGFTHSQIDSYVCDGYGTLTLPTGTDTAVLRVRVVSHSKDSSSFSGVTYARTETYNWYKAGFHNPILTVSYDTMGDPGGNQYVSYVTYYTKKANTLGVTDASKMINTLSVYPNPASNQLHLKFDAQDNSGAFLTISDVTGRVVNTINNIAERNNDITVSVSDLSAGVYLVRLQTNTGSITQKVVIAK